MLTLSQRKKVNFKTTKVTMYLEDWIKKKNISYTKFRELMNIERTTLYYWIKGIKKPNINNMKKIKLLTEGKVTYEEISKT